VLIKSDLKAVKYYTLSRISRNSDSYWFLPRCIEWKAVYSGESCLSVHPSVKRMHCDKTKEKTVQIFIPYERPLSLVF